MLLRGCSRPQFLHFIFVGFLLLLCLFKSPFMAFMSFFSLSSCSSCDVVVSYVLTIVDGFVEGKLFALFQLSFLDFFVSFQR